MKRILFLALAIATLCSCKKEPVEQPLEDCSMNISINVNKTLTRAIEGGHAGNNNDEVAPKIFAVTVLSYNSVGTLLGAVDLTATQIKDAVWGTYRNQDGTTGAQTSKPVGATVGLPKGSTHVDVVINRPSTSDFSTNKNINNFNYHNNLNGDGVRFPFGDDNFDRTILTTTTYGIGGTPLTGRVPVITTPTYNMSFSVKPYYSRMEVYGGLDVADSQVWIDGYKNQWRTMSVTDYEAATGETPDTDGNYTKGAVKGTIANGFDVTKVYISEYYWYRESNAPIDPVVRDVTNTYQTEDEVNNNPGIKAGWILQPQYINAPADSQVKWLPNRFYAIDIESVFINNIKVRDAERAPYLHPWPGNEATSGWPNWYKAFHSFGWHSAGSSIGNTFLCMGNMWDQIADSDKYKDVTIPETAGNTTMKIIDGKAKAIANVSNFYSSNTRNLGVANGKAASYVFYPQHKAQNTSSTNAELLRNELPHIILKLKAYSNEADYAAGKYVAGKEFITVTLFSDAAAGAAGNYITNFQGGYIYRLNINDLRYAFIGDVPVPNGKPTDGKDPKDPIDPDPEMPGSKLIMDVQVLPWLIQNIFPSI